MVATRCLVVSVLMLALVACVASAADHPVSAKKLSIKNKNGKQKLVLAIKDAGLGFPLALGADDPRTVSMELELFSGGGDSAVLSMPDSGWDLRKNSWLFKNRAAPAGISPVRRLRLTAGKRLRVVSRQHRLADAFPRMPRPAAARPECAVARVPRNGCA
ncbi:MAG: hypothetical protein ACE5D3_01495 [Candidatus Binatia bacterium]